MLPPSLDSLRLQQDGVLTRAQLAAVGVSASDIERFLRRRDLVRVRPGVFVDHTGELTWRQQAWVGVLTCWPAALTHESSLAAHHGSTCTDGTIRLVVATDRRRRAPAGYRLHRSSAFPGSVRWNLSPPRTTYETAVLDLAAEAEGDLDVVRVIADACGSRRTTAARLLAELRSRPRWPRRALVTDVLADVGSGTWSVLEREYVRRVERPHGLPTPVRQAREQTPQGVLFRDGDLQPYGLVVELDGRAFHEGAEQRDRDLARDLHALETGRRTVRLGWAQVVGRPCATAASLARVLRAGGWSGTPRSCGPECAIDADPHQ